MKFVHITFRFEFSQAVEKILDLHQVQDYVRYPMMEGKGLDGKHCGTQVCPGNMTIVQAQVQEENLKPLLTDLQEFKQARSSHQHLQALVLPVLQRLD